MKAKVKRTIYLPSDLVQILKEIATSEEKTLNALIEETLRKRKADYLWAQFKELQKYGARMARAKGIRTEADLQRYLAK